MKVKCSLKSAKTRDKDCKLVRRKGRVYVIDGHNRIDLAKRSNMNEVNVQIINAVNVEDAKAEAAIINVNKFIFPKKC